MDIFISYLGTDIPKNFRTKIHNNEKEFLGRLAEMVLKADDLFKQWAVASLGKIVFVNGGLGCVNVSSEKAVELPKVKAELEMLIGSVSMGVGTNIDESWIACEHGAKNGGGKIVLYELGMEKEDSSKDLSKAEPKKKLEPENKENPKEIKDPPADVPTPLLDDNVGGQDVPPSGAPEGEDEEPSAIQMIAQALTDVKQHAQTIEKLKSVDPQAFEAVKNIISAMILMANNMMEMKQAAEPQADPAGAPPVGGPPAAPPAPDAAAQPPQGVPAVKSEQLDKGHLKDIFHGASVGAAEGMHDAHHRTAGDAKGVVAGAAVGAVKGAIKTAIPKLLSRKVKKDEDEPDLEKAGQAGKYSTVPLTAQVKLRKPTRSKGRGPRRRLPVGSAKNGKKKVVGPDGKPKWVTIK